VPDTKQLDFFRTNQYLITLVLEVVTGLVRVGVTFIALGLLFSAIALGVYFDQLSNSSLLYRPRLDFAPPIVLAFLISVAFGYRNVFRSWLSYMGFVGGDSTTQFVLGAREPSRREQELLSQAFKQMVQQASQPIKSFSHLFILDSPLEFAYVIGTTLYITSGALRGRHFQVLLAHEIGHLHYGHGGTILALRRFLFPMFQYILSGVRDFSTAGGGYKPMLKEFDSQQIYYHMVNKALYFNLALWGGGLGVSLRSTAWAAYFRECDYVADAFAVQLGFKEELLSYLEETKFYDTSVPYMLSWYPANEQRIDQILNPTYKQQAGGEGKVTIRPFIEEGEADYKITISLREAFAGSQTTIKTKTGQTVTSRVPRGVATGNAIIRNDLGKVFIRVLDDPDFDRRDNDLYTRLFVSRDALEKGGDVEVPTMDGVVKVQIPPGTGYGKNFRFPGQGMPILGKEGQRGDFVVTLRKGFGQAGEEVSQPVDQSVIHEVQTGYTEAELQQQTKAWLVEKMQERKYPLPAKGKGASKHELISAFLEGQEREVVESVHDVVKDKVVAQFVDVQPPQLLEITDDLSAEELRKRRIANSKARSAFHKAVRAAGVNPEEVEIIDGKVIWVGKKTL